MVQYNWLCRSKIQRSRRPVALLLHSTCTLPLLLASRCWSSSLVQSTDCTTNAGVGVACGRVCLIFISVCVSVRSVRTRIDPRSFQFSLRSMYLVPSRTALHLHGNVWCVDDAAECRHIQCHGHGVPAVPLLQQAKERNCVHSIDGGVRGDYWVGVLLGVVQEREGHHLHAWQYGTQCVRPASLVHACMDTQAEACPCVLFLFSGRGRQRRPCSMHAEVQKEQAAVRFIHLHCVVERLVEKKTVKRREYMYKIQCPTHYLFIANVFHAWQLAQTPAVYIFPIRCRMHYPHQRKTRLVCN